MASSTELQDTAEGERKPATHASFSAKEEFADQAKAFRTPLKRKTDVLDEVAYLAFTPHKRQALEPESLNGLTEAEILSRVIEFFNKVDTSLAETAEIVMTFLTAYETSAKEFSRGLKSLELRITDVTDDTGSPPEGLSEEFASPSIWGTISSLASKLGDLEKQAIGADELSNTIKAVEARLLARLTSDTNMLDTKHASLASDVRVLSMAPNPVTTLQSDLVSVKGTILTMGRLMGKRIGSEAFRIDMLEHSSGHVNSAVAKPIVNSNQAQFAVEFGERVDRLEIDMNKLTAANDEQAIQFASLGFRRIEEAASWLAIHCPHNEFGLVVDPHMVFEHIHYNMHGEDALGRLQKLYKLKIETIGQGISITSFENSLPKVLSTNHQSVVQTDISFFDKLPTHAEWALNEEGWHDKFKKGLHDFQVAHKKTIGEELDPESKMYSIAILSLAESVAWVSGFLSFIQDYYEDLTMGKFGSRKGWHVTTRLAKRLIEEVHVPRSSVIKSIKTGNAPHIAKHLFWASLKSMDICARIKNNNFKNDPLVSSELVKFLAVNTGFESLEKLIREVAELKDKVIVSSKAVAVAEKSASTASNKADENKKLIDVLLKRVTKLESK
jgi:hypothetical protein